MKAQYLPEDEREAVDRHIDEYDRLTEALKGIERDTARAAPEDDDVRMIMTSPGFDMVVAVGLMAAIGRVDRFEDPDKLVAILASIRASASRVTGPLIMAGSRSGDDPTPVIFWSKWPGRRSEPPVL